MCFVVVVVLVNKLIIFQVAICNNCAFMCMGRMLPSLLLISWTILSLCLKNELSEIAVDIRKNLLLRTRYN